jgi:hypothetical protein
MASECAGEDASEAEVDYGERAAMVAAQRALFAEDAAAFERALRATPALLADSDAGGGGQPLANYLFQQGWAEGQGIYFALGGTLAPRSVDWASHLGGGGVSVALVLAGGRTALHEAALRARAGGLPREAFEALRAAHPAADVLDSDGRSPQDLLDAPPLSGAAQVAAVREERVRVLARIRAARVYVALASAPDAGLLPAPGEGPAPGVRCFAAPRALCAALAAAAAALPPRPPNSMHRYGRVFAAGEPGILAMARALLPPAAAQRVRRVFAFFHSLLCRGPGAADGPGQPQG